MLEILIIILGMLAIILIGAVIFIITLLKKTKTPLLPKELSDNLNKITEAQSKFTGHFEQFSTQNNANFNRITEKFSQQDKQISEKLHNQDKQITEKISQQTIQGKELMGDVKARLTEIITAQKQIDSLSSSVLDLKTILDDKQKRGLYGEVRLMDQVKDALPSYVYSLQKKLSNGKIVDCMLHFPGEPGNLAIDSKFPLEGYRKLSDSSTEEDIRNNRKIFSVAVLKHVKDIAEKYIITGETADSAIMFVPSETIYGEIFTTLPDIVAKAFKLQVYITSPNTLMALLATMRSILRDTQMREQSSRLRDEVIKIGEDIDRLDNRVGKLATHYRQMGEDIDNIQISTSKISNHAQNVKNLDVPKAIEISHQQSEIPQNTLPKL